MITGIDHVAVAVEDWDAAVGCYARLLGQPLPARLRLLGVRAALFALANTRILLLESGREGIAGLGLAVADGQACCLRLEAAGSATSVLASEPDSGVQLWELAPRHTRGLRLRIVQRDRAERPAAASFAADQVEALDHVVIRSAAPERAVQLYGTTLGMRLALDRELAGTRMLFFRTGGVTLEVIADPSASDADSFYGLAYRVRDLGAVHARLTAAGFSLSEPRAGRKPGTQVFSVRSSTCGVPTLFIRDASRD